MASKADLGLLMLTVPPIVMIRTPAGRQAVEAPEDADGIFLGHTSAEEFLGYLSEGYPNLTIDMYEVAEICEEDLPLHIGVCISADLLERAARIDQTMH